VKKYEPNLSTAILTLEIIGNLLRLLYVSIDFLYVRLIFPFEVAIICVTVSLPFELSATFLFAHFYRLANNSMEINLRRWKIIIIAAISFLFIFEIILDIIRAANATFAGVATVVVGVLYLIVYLILSVYFFVETYKMAVQLKNAKKESGKETSKFYKYVVIVVTGMVITIIGIIILGTPLFQDPPIALFTWVVIYAGLAISSFGKIYVFTNKKK